ncbi:MAG: RNA polymerase sigma factor [Gammaproteobacteria bacterium]|nr:RNA polymerase sigma factor [Gammaproteobacteria bacterium]
MRQDLSEKLVELIPRMRRFAAGLTGSTDAGDELVQGACERLLRNRDKLRPDTQLDRWLYRVIRNLHVDGIRAHATRDRHLQEIGRTAELHLVTNNTLEDRVHVSEVDRAMRQLSDEHRAVLMLIAVEGLTYREAAGVLDVPIGTVTSRLARARGALMDKLQAGRDDDPVGAAG